MTKRDITTPGDDELVGFFARHLVPVLFTFEKEGLSDSLVMTTFVLSVDEQWFLVTAGHCIRDVERIIASGCQIVECHLVDSMGLDAKHLDPIPFAYTRSHPMRLSEDKSSWFAYFSGQIENFASSKLILGCFAHIPRHGLNHPSPSSSKLICDVGQPP